MRNVIEQNYTDNKARVQNLVKIYTDNFQGQGGGRRSTLKTDILRASVVLLHASLEEVLRSLMIWKYPLCSGKVLEKLPFAGQGKRNAKISMQDLLEFRGKTVDEILEASVKEYANVYSFNSTTEIASILSNCGITCTDLIVTTYPSMEEMIERRHAIVHQADKYDTPGSGNHNVKSIAVGTVNKWIEKVDTLVKEVLNCIDTQLQSDCQDAVVAEEGNAVAVAAVETNVNLTPNT